MGRAEAIKGKVIRDARGIPTGKRDEATKILPAQMQEWIQKRGVILRGSGVDEAPQAYRRLSEVLKDQGPTINIRHTLTPKVVVMAGGDIKDPYKD
jgi:tRNA-splicing ligase RtcB